MANASWTVVATGARRSVAAVARRGTRSLCRASSANSEPQCGNPPDSTQGTFHLTPISFSCASRRHRASKLSPRARLRCVRGRIVDIVPADMVARPIVMQQLRRKRRGSAYPRHSQIRGALSRLCHRSLCGTGGALSQAVARLSRRPAFKASHLFPGLRGRRSAAEPDRGRPIEGQVAAIMIREGLARPYICGATSCPQRQPWCAG
jgi:hypothetical protein